jgi:hypothetical protein
MTDAGLIAKRARELLPLDEAYNDSEYGYKYLDLCVLDSVWSIGVRYEGVRNVVQRYCQFTGLPDPWSPEYHTGGSDQNRDGLGHLTKRIASFGFERSAEELFGNRQRTSSRGGILKAEAVFQFADALINGGIREIGDMQNWNELLETKIRTIPGQRSGLSVRYFLMLSGAQDLAKPDRMINRFIEKSIGRITNPQEAQDLLTNAAMELSQDFPRLTTRVLDNLIWTYQRKLST